MLALLLLILPALVVAVVAEVAEEDAEEEEEVCGVVKSVTNFLASSKSVKVLNSAVGKEWRAIKALENA
jgi:hypothetical protein